MTRNRAVAVASACVLAAIVGALCDVERLPRAWLFAWTTWTGLALGCLGLLLLSRLVGGAWSVAVRRPLEAGAATVPWMAVGFAPVVIAMSRIYPWASETAHVAPTTSAFRDTWLRPAFFVARAAVYFACWSIAALRLRHLSREEERADSAAAAAEVAARARRFCAPALLVSALAVTFAAVDWTMSLEPEWSSAAYGAIVLTGQIVTAVAFAILVLVALERRGEAGARLEPAQLHDLGNLLLAFVMLWAYVSFGQYLVLWSGNLPAESGWVIRRTTAGWRWIAWALLVLHFLLPFLALLSRELKRGAATLGAVAAGVVAMRVVEQYWLVDPAFDRDAFRLHWLDGLMLAAIGAAWLVGFAAALRSGPRLSKSLVLATQGAVDD